MELITGWKVSKHAWSCQRAGGAAVQINVISTMIYGHFVLTMIGEIVIKNDKNEIDVRGRLHLEVPKFFKNDNYA